MKAQQLDHSRYSKKGYVWLKSDLNLLGYTACSITAFMELWVVSIWMCPSSLSPPVSRR